MVRGGQWDAGLQLPVLQLPGGHRRAFVHQAARGGQAEGRVGQQPRLHARVPRGSPQRGQGDDNDFKEKTFRRILGKSFG